MVGWWSSIFIFLYLFWHEISEAVKETRRHGKIHEVLNSTYLTLIPKNDQAHTFNDFDQFVSVIYYTKLSQNSLLRD